MTVRCADCGRENAPDAAFCDACGTAFSSGCPTCGKENRPDARFCRGCGSRLDGEAAAGAQAPTGDATAGVEGAVAERRLVSVLFADLVGFTESSEARDSEAVRETLTRYFEATREVIERHGGQVEKFIGDAVMAEWGAPRTREDDAERAVRAALEVVDAVRDLGEGLQTRVAVLTGQAAVTIGATDQGMVAGDLVNTAARLQGVAPPDTVLVGENTMRAASGAIAFEEAGEQPLKGKTAPVRAWRALRVVAEAGASEAIEPPFVGRELELRLLKDLVNAADSERRPRLVSITGPAGIGKSRLVWELEQYTASIAELVYWHRGRSPSYGDGIAFWALGEMVRRRAKLVESADEPTTREHIHATVNEFIEPADMAWIEAALLTLLGLEPPPVGGREELFAAWRTFFERIAQQHPVVMIFEDLHWADDGQLDFIEHLLEWSHDVPLLVITLARPDLLERRPGWGTGARSFNAIGLEPLIDANMRELITGLVPNMPEALLEQVLARADGIPLYAVEMLRTLIADGRLAAVGDGSYRLTGELGELGLPDSLRALIAARLDALDAADRALIGDATVLGQTFDHRALAAITEQDEAAVEARLRVLVKREVLEILADPSSPERGQFSFVQSVIREVAYDTFSRHDRRARHLAAARYYEATGDEELAAVLATHYVAAYDATDEGPERDALRVEARGALRGAAERAATLGAYEQAVAHLDAAIAITEDRAELAQLHADAAAVAQAAAGHDDAIRHADLAVSLFDSAGRERDALRATASLATVQVEAGHVEESKRTALAALERADAAEHPDIRADLLARLSRAHMRLNEIDEAIATADEALTLAEPLQLDRVVAEALVNKGSALSRHARVHEPTFLLRGGADLAEQAGDLDLNLRATMNLGIVLRNQDLEFLLRTYQGVLESARVLGRRLYADWLTAFIPYFTVLAGRDWDEVLEMASEGLTRATSTFGRHTHLIGLFALEVMRGADTTERQADLKRTLEQLGGDPFVPVGHIEGYQRLLGGDEHGAVTAMRESIGLMTIGRALEFEARLGLTLTAAKAGDLEAAREAERISREDTSAGRAVDANRVFATASVAALDGRPDEAAPGVVRAVGLLREAGWHFMVAAAQTVALDLLPGRPELAGWADEARERFELVGAEPWLRMLERVTQGTTPNGTPAEEEVSTAP